jgi:hypothetical protein
LRAFALDLDLGFGFAVGFSSFDFNVLIFWSLLLLKRLTEAIFHRKIVLLHATRGNLFNMGGDLDE